MSQGNKEKKISEIIKGKLIRKKEENYLTNEILTALRNSPGLAGRQTGGRRIRVSGSQGMEEERLRTGS